MTTTEETVFTILTTEMSELDEDIKTQERRVKHLREMLGESQNRLGLLISSPVWFEIHFLDFLKEKREKLYQEWKVLYDKKNGEFRGQVK